MAGLHTRLCKIFWQIFEVSYLFVSYNIIISWLYTLNGFQIIFLLRDSATQEYFKKWGLAKIVVFFFFFIIGIIMRKIKQ